MHLQSGIVLTGIAEHESVGAHHYANSIRVLLRRLIAEEYPGYDEDREEELFNRLPLIQWSFSEETSGHLSVLLLCRKRPYATKFFYEMLSRWLVPGKRLDFALCFTADFQLFDTDDETYTIAEVFFTTYEKKIFQACLKNLPLIEMEIRLGIASAYHASRILESKGLSTDEKTTTIHEMIASLIQRRPRDFDYDLFSQMQHFLVMCRDEFKGIRECRQMCRIICVFYLFRKALRALVEEFPEKRHLNFKIASARLHLPLGMKQVLSIFVGVNFLKENELFEENHLVSALCNYIPKVRAVKGSFFSSRSRDDKIQTLYLEVEKEDGSFFTQEEREKLKKGLPVDLKGRVEHLIRPVFMPRNEEEVMRNLLVLSKQLKYIRDLPQMIISFDGQNDTELSFVIILVRVLHENSEILHSQLASSSLKFHVDRIKRLGLIRNKYPKEGSVFRVRLANDLFLRQDHSVDLYKARQKVVHELQQIFGEVRDYNGGMIAKQIESFQSLKTLLGSVAIEHEFLLENFFHAIFPVELRSILSPEPLKILFIMLLDMMQYNELFKYKIEPQCGYFLLQIRSVEEEEKILNTVSFLHLTPPQLVSLHLKVLNTTYLGYIYFCDDSQKQEAFKKALLDFSI